MALISLFGLEEKALASSLRKVTQMPSMNPPSKGRARRHLGNLEEEVEGAGCLEMRVDIQKCKMKNSHQRVEVKAAPLWWNCLGRIRKQTWSTTVTVLSVCLLRVDQDVIHSCVDWLSAAVPLPLPHGHWPSETTARLLFLL